MAIRTQIRLDQIKARFGDSEGGIVDNLPTSADLASIPAGSGSMVSVMSELASAIKRIHGGSSFVANSAGVFSAASQFEENVQLDKALSVAGVSSLSAITGSAGLQLAGDLEVGAAAVLKSSLELTGNADLNGQLDVAGAVSLAAAGVQSTFRGSLQVDQAANIDGTLDVTSAATLDSTLDVIGAATLSSTLDVTGAATLSDTLAVSGNATLSADLSAAGAISFSGVSGTSAASDPDVSISGYANIAKDVKLQSALEVGGAADLKSTLDVAGNSDLKGTLAVAENATFAKDISAVSGSFSGDVTISGNLVVQGGTTTVETVDLIVQDTNIVLGKGNENLAIQTGTGLTFAGTSPLTFQWNGAGGHSDMELKLGSNFAKLHVGDLAAEDAVFSKDISAVSGSLSGDLTVSGDIQSAQLAVTTIATLASAEISSLTDNRIVIAGASGLLEDDANLTFNGTQLAVGSYFTVQHGTGAARVGKLEIDGANDYIDVDGGALKIKSSNSVIQYLDSGNSVFLKQISDSFNGQMKQASSAAQLFMKEDAGNLYEYARFVPAAMALLMAGQNQIRFNDDQEAIWSDGNKLSFKSGGQAYTLPSSGVQADRFLSTDGSGNMYWVDSTTNAARKYFDIVASGGLASGSVFTPSVNDYTTLNNKADKLIDIYVNGQLMHINKKTVTATYDIGGNYDASINTVDNGIKFSFDLEAGDRITVVGR